MPNQQILLDQIEILNQEKFKLQEELEELKKKYKEVKEQNKEVKEQNKELREEYDELRRENPRVELKHLREEYEELRRQNARVRKAAERNNEHISRLVYQKQRMQDKKVQLSIEYYQASQTINKLMNPQ
uniref:Uncharacterized protein n=1 Tax=Panagrolaimus sp. JU765 TaxID=591449 RepID=A0AC34PYG4_9BILA